MQPEPQLLVCIMLNFQRSPFCLGTRAAGCWLVWRARENVGEAFTHILIFFLSREKTLIVSSALQILSSQNSLSLLWIHGNTIIAGLSKYPLLGIFVVII